MPARAQTARERRAGIRASVDGGNDAAAINDLRAWLLADPSGFALNNYDYLLAGLSARQGDMAAASASFQQVAARASVLSEYALWHMALMARATGNPILERERLRQLIATSRLEYLRNAAQARLAESLFESGDYEETVRALQGRASTGSPQGREALVLVAQAYLRSGQLEQARKAFNDLSTVLPDAARPDDYALAGVRGLDQLDSGTADAAPEKAPVLSEKEHQRRAFIYNFNRDFAAARRHYVALAERFPQSASAADALFQTGRTFYQESRFDEAIDYFRRVAEKFPDSTSARDALTTMAAAYSRTKRPDEAIAVYQRIMERYTESDVLERAHLNLVDVLRDAARDREALDWVKKTRERFRGQAAALALFSQLKIHLAGSAWNDALADLEALRQESDLGGGRAAGGTNQTELAFARAYVLQQLGRADEAVNAYLAIPDGRNEYYGWRATLRLREMARAEATRNQLSSRLSSLRADAVAALAAGDAERARALAQSALRLTEDAATTREMLDLARQAYSRLPAYNRLPQFQLTPFGRQEVLAEGARPAVTPTHKTLADELLFLGLYDEAAQELAFAEQFLGTNPSAVSADSRYTLAVLYRRGEMADRAVRFAEPIWKTMPSDYLLELAPAEMVELFYPAPYRAPLLEYAPPRGVDPRFALSIMRQESRFRADAKSVSAARGLMQFIPSTADTMAAQLNRKNFRQDDLYDPRVAVLFGSQYLGNLFKQFPDMPQAVAASYNGGEDNVARWLARSRTNDPDRYVMEISYAQSKDYVYKVLANFRVYQTLYDEQLRRK